ncbi:hypothetical protein TREES_T100010959 [Tupaia chinensis]|uniref:Uncharacterized protein n=1 Tax=Tupaia chinensis TaxID=246437 RepID=L9JES5_TUPCH|nr:hypothetical protein TREES_T100010959 [Tupaia chinensis]
MDLITSSLAAKPPQESRELAVRGAVTAELHLNTRTLLQTPGSFPITFPIRYSSRKAFYSWDHICVNIPELRLYPTPTAAECQGRGQAAAVFEAAQGMLMGLDQGLLLGDSYTTADWVLT